MNSNLESAFRQLRLLISRLRPAQSFFQRKKISVLLVFFIFSLFSVPAFSLAPTEVNAKIEASVLIKKKEIVGLKAKIEFLGLRTHFKGNNAKPCLYLPWNDVYSPLFNQRVDYLKLRDLKSEPMNLGQLNLLNIDSGQWEKRSPYLYEWHGKSLPDQLSLDFEVYLAKLKAHEDSKSYVFDYFHPVILEECPGTIQTWPAVIKAKYQTQVEGEGPFKVIGNLMEDNAVSRQSLSFIRDYKEKNLENLGIPIVIYYQNDSFLKLSDTIARAYNSHQELLGKYPFKALSIIESSKGANIDMAGLMVMGEPRHGWFRKLEKDVINWAHWVVVKLMAYQWLGTSIRPTMESDQALVYGLNEYATFIAIKSNPLRFNLFNLFEFPFLGLSLSYDEAQYIGNQWVIRSKNSKKIGELYRYLRIALSFRHLEFILGEQSIKTFISELILSHRHGNLGRTEFWDFFNRNPSSISNHKKLEVESLLKEWWEGSEWPDFFLEGIESKKLEGGEKLVSIKIGQKSKIDSDVRVKLRFPDGHEKVLITETIRAGQHQIQILGDSEPIYIEIDPYREILDIDRFNNRSGFPKLRFFPGGTQKLEDDAYTFVYFPYASKRPGEYLSLGLRFGILKFLESSWYGYVEKSLENRNFAFRLNRSASYNNPGYRTRLTLAQNMQGGQEVSAKAMTPGLSQFGIDYELGLGLVGRRIALEVKREILGLSADFALGSADLFRPCSLALEGGLEKGIGGYSQEFFRKKALLKGYCPFFFGGIHSRYFRGAINGLKSEKGATRLLGFRPNDLSESRIRVDFRQLSETGNIWSTGHDFEFPLNLAFPKSSFVLSEKVMAKLFYDTGRDLESNIWYRSAGGGLGVPFGGDLSGIGSIALSNFSLLGIFYMAKNEKVSYKPRFVFDFNADL